MTSPLFRMVAHRVTEEQHQRRSDGRELTEVRVAPMVAEALSEEAEEMYRSAAPPKDKREGMTIRGVAIVPDDDLSAMEVDR